MPPVGLVVGTVVALASWISPTPLSPSALDAPTRRFLLVYQTPLAARPAVVSVDVLPGPYLWVPSALTTRRALASPDTAVASVGLEAAASVRVSVAACEVVATKLVTLIN